MSISKVNSMNIYDDVCGHREIRAGDKVIILPIEHRVQFGIDEDDYWAEKRVESLNEFLEVEGPYLVAWIGLWPCGRHMLYFTIGDREPGAHAKDFMFAH